MPDGPQAAAHLAGALARADLIWIALRHGIRCASVHTGVPAVVVAAVGLVAGYRLARRTVRFAVQLTVAMTVVLLATYFGWLSF